MIGGIVPRLASLLPWLVAIALAAPAYGRQSLTGLGAGVGVQQPQSLADFDAATNCLTAAWAGYDPAGNLDHFKFPGNAAFDWTAAYDAENCPAPAGTGGSVSPLS